MAERTGDHVCQNLPKSNTGSALVVTSEVTGTYTTLPGTLTADLDEILTDNTSTLEEILQEEGIMAQERSKLTKHRKLENSFEDLLTGLSDESDDDIDDLVNFDNLPEMCSEDTLIAITKINKPYTSAATLDDSLKLSDFVEEKKDYKQKQQETHEDTTKHSNLFDDDNDFVSKQSKDVEENIENDKLIDFDDVMTPETVGMTTETVTAENNDIFEIENQNYNEKLIDFEGRETEDNNFRDFDDDKIDYENSSESNNEEDENDRYDGDFIVEDDEKKDDGVELMVTDESGNALDMDQDLQELPVDGRKREESIDLDAIVQDNAHLDVDIGIQKTQLRKRGSLAKRRKPSRTSIHSMGGANEESHFTDSTELKPEMQNGHSDESDVFSRQSSSNDGEATSPPAKKPLPGMVALPGMMGMPMLGQRKKTQGSTPSDSDLTPEDQPQKDFKPMGVKLPIPSSRGSSGSDEQFDIRSPVLRKTSDRETEKPLIENTQQFEKPKLRAVSHPRRDRKESNEDNDSAMFDMPTLKQVEKSPRKSQSSANDSEDTDKHLFQTPKLRRVENAPTESLRFVHGKTGESDDDDENLPKSRISDDSKHVFHTPKLKRVDNPPTQTLKLLHGRTDETSEAETKLSLGHHNEESNTDDLDIGTYFEKPQLRNVPKPTETLRRIDQERAQFEVPSLKNVPKTEFELKSPSALDSDTKFNVPQLKSVQKEKANDNEDRGEGVFQIPTLRSTPLPKRREPPKSPETKTFDVPVLRRTPRVKQESEQIEPEKPPTGVFEKPKLKSARSLQQDMDDMDSKDSHGKHRFDVPSLRSTPSKKESSVQKSDVKKTESEKPSWLQETKLRTSHSSSFETSSGDQDEQKPSWLSDSKERDSAKENKNTNSHDYIDSTPRKSSIPLQETRGHQDNAINGHPTPSRSRLLSSGSDKDGDDLKVKGKKGTGRDQYVPSWLKTADIRGKSPSTPNLAFVTPSKDTSEVPQWKRDLAEKRKGRKDSDAGLSPRRQESTAEKELPPWKVEMGQKKMRQTPLKAQETKKSTEPEWKKAADEKRQRLRSLGDSNYDDDAVETKDLTSE